MTTAHWLDPSRRTTISLLLGWCYWSYRCLGQETRFLEIAIDSSSADVLEVGDTISELANNSNTPGSATGDAGHVESIRRELRVSLNPGSPTFQANQNVADANSTTVLIAAVENDYDTRLYGVNQRWASIAPRPTTSAWVEDRGGYNDLMHILVLDGDGKLTGTPGALLEKHLNVSKASDARLLRATTSIQESDQTYSQYLYWGSHETNNIYDRDTNASGGFGLSGVNREFDLIKSDNSLNNLDDPTGLNPLAVPLVGTKGRATLRFALQGGVDGYTISRPNILGAYGSSTMLRRSNWITS